MFCTIFELIRYVLGGLKQPAERTAYLFRTRTMAFAQAPAGDATRQTGLEPRQGAGDGRLPVMRGGAGEGGRGAMDAGTSPRKGGQALGGAELAPGARQPRGNPAQRWVMTRKGFYIGI